MERRAGLEVEPYRHPCGPLPPMPGAAPLAGLDALCLRKRWFPPHTELVREGDAYGKALLFTDGWAIRHKTLPDGRRQILDFILPGDYCCLRRLVVPVANESVTALTECSAVEVPFDNRGMGGGGHLGTVLGYMFRTETNLCHRIVDLGRRSATERMAHLFVELLERLRPVGFASETGYVLPLTQEVLADVLGLSTVHTNRVLQRLRRQGLVSLDHRRELLIKDLDGLRNMAGVEPGLDD